MTAISKWLEEVEDWLDAAERSSKDGDIAGQHAAAATAQAYVARAALAVQMMGQASAVIAEVKARLRCYQGLELSIDPRVTISPDGTTIVIDTRNFKSGFSSRQGFVITWEATEVERRAGWKVELVIDNLGNGHGPCNPNRHTLHVDAGGKAYPWCEVCGAVP